MIQKIKGVVDGQTIKVEGKFNLRDGDRVELTIEKITENGERSGEGPQWRGSTIADCWTEEDDRILEQIYLDRHNDPRPEVQW